MEPANARCRRLATLLLRILRCKPSIGEPFEGREFDVGQLRQVKFDNNRVLWIAGAAQSCRRYPGAGPAVLAAGRRR
jgi:hypothetical protein